MYCSLASVPTFVKFPCWFCNPHFSVLPFPYSPLHLSSFRFRPLRIHLSLYQIPTTPRRAANLNHCFADFHIFIALLFYDICRQEFVFPFLSLLYISIRLGICNSLKFHLFHFPAIPDSNFQAKIIMGRHLQSSTGPFTCYRCEHTFLAHLQPTGLYTNARARVLLTVQSGCPFCSLMRAKYQTPSVHQYKIQQYSDNLQQEHPSADQYRQRETR